MSVVPPSIMDHAPQVAKNFWPVRLASIVGAVAFAAILDQLVKSAGSGLLAERMVTLAALYVTLSVSLNLVNGITGQFSIGHAAFFQVGAYAAAIFSMQRSPAGVDPNLWILGSSILGGLAAGLAGLLVGLPSLRLRGDYLAIVTLGFGEIIRNFANTQAWVGGAYGTNVAPKQASVGLAILLAIVSIAVCRNLLRTAHGLPFLSIREDEVAASAMGVNSTFYKVTAFVLASVLAGAAGGIFAHTEGFISPRSFGMDLSFMILTMVVLGGSGSITGSAVVAVVLFYLPEALRDAPALRGPVVISAIVMLIALTASVKRMDNFHGGERKRQWLVGLVPAIGGSVVLGLLLSFVPDLAKTNFEADRLRMVIFSLALIIAMLLRPQGIFAHHEFSWDWLRSRLKRRTA